MELADVLTKINTNNEDTIDVIKQNGNQLDI